MRSLALLATAMTPAAAAAACEGELLHNNIFLPAQWPPRVGLSRRAPTPPYLAAPPAVIRVDAGGAARYGGVGARLSLIHI